MMTFMERGKTESLAEHLLRNAHLLGADRGQVARLRVAFRLSVGGRADKTEGGLLAAQVRDELEEALQSALANVKARGERMAPFNDAGACRVKNRDGLANLVESGALSDVAGRAGLAYRLAHEAGCASLRSALGRLGEGGGAAPRGGMLHRSPAELQRAYLMVQLRKMEMAAAGLPDPKTGRVYVIEPDGRELMALRMVAGEGLTIEEVSGGGGHAKALYKAALGRALGGIATALRITAG
jgi:hypothetical protein